QILGELRAAVRRERGCVENRLRQPGTHVLLTRCARRLQRVETNPRRRGHEERSRVGHLVAFGPVPAHVRLLHRVLGISQRSEHAICETEQTPAVQLETGCGIRCPARGAHVIRPAATAMRREFATTTPPRTVPMSPNTRAAAPPTTPLPEPGPPVAIAKTSPPLMAPIGPSTRATIAPRRP